MEKRVRSNVIALTFREEKQGATASGVGDGRT